MEQTTHVYFEWQCATLMYAYDVGQPIARLNENAIAERRRRVEEEVYQLFLEVVPREVRDNPTEDFSPEVVMNLTRATLRRAVAICDDAARA
jgi:hypothetical protein